MHPVIAGEHLDFNPEALNLSPSRYTQRFGGRKSARADGKATHACVTIHVRVREGLFISNLE